MIAPRHAGRTAAGFTLVEILVVLIILSVAAGLISLAVTSDERDHLQREAQRLSGALEYASDRARWRHEIVGIAALPDGRGWRFWSIPEATDTAGTAAKTWQAIANDDPLATHNLPAGITLRPLSYGGQALTSEAILPLLPSGRVEPYALELRGAEWRVQLAADPLGRLTVSLPIAVSTETP